MQKNGESIYGTSACPLEDFPWGRCTVKGQKIYLHVFSWPADATLRISGLQNEVAAAYPLGDPSLRLSVGQANGAITVGLPARSRDENDTVVVLEISGQPVVDPPLIVQESDAPFELDYLQAVTAGKAVKRFNRDGGFHISKWTGPADSITWHVQVSLPGSYRVSIRYAAREEWARNTYLVTVGAQSLAAAVEATGDGFEYKKFNLGEVTVPKAGAYTVKVRPAKVSDHDLMYFQSLILEPE
jgi:alpha-L-fucosidase